MTETLTVGGLDFSVKRSAKRKTVRVSIERDRTLWVHIPELSDMARVAEIVEQRLVWVYEKLLKLPDPPVPLPVFRRKEFIDGEGFHLLGRHYQLKLVQRPQDGSPTMPVYLDAERLCLREDFKGDAENQIAKFFTREAHPYLNERVEVWKRRLGVEPKRFVNVQDLGYRWGSCSSDGTLNFHWRTIQLPTNVIDYVVVHELTHLKVPDHSQEFWSALAAGMPDYEQRRSWLKDNAHRL